jgi:cholesterol transport system auxiliary component
MRYFTLLCSAFLLTSCALLETPEPLPLYTLESGTFEPTNVLSTSLAVDVPLCEASIDTQRIALTPSPYQREYFADGSWPAHLSDVFYEALLDGLTQRWGGIHVNRLKAALETQHLLRTDIQDFAIYGMETGIPEAHLKVTFKVVDLRKRNVVAARTFDVKVPLSCLSMQEIVRAFNEGTHVLLEKAMGWMEQDVFSRK